MRRRDFIKVIVGSVVWPLAANAQTSNKPVIGFLSARSAKESAHLVDAFRKGLAEHGIVEGQNVTIQLQLGRQPIRAPGRSSHRSFEPTTRRADIGRRRHDCEGSIRGHQDNAHRCDLHRRSGCRRVCHKPEQTRRQYYRRQQFECGDRGKAHWTVTGRKAGHNDRGCAVEPGKYNCCASTEGHRGSGANDWPQG